METAHATDEDGDNTMLSPDEAPSTPSSVVSVEGSTISSDNDLRTAIRHRLDSCLSRVQYVGDFMSYKATQLNVDPGLHIDNVGNISLPLPSSDAKKIMATSRQAPFGRGSKTIVDKSFRNTKELDIDHFRLRNPAWEQYLQDIIRVLGAGLGFPESPAGIQAKLYKLLLYEKVITYNLVRTHGPGSAETVLHERAVLDGILKEWTRCVEASQPTIPKLAYFLDHKYTEANLQFSRLKGRDRLLGRYLREACESEGFTVLLANLTFTEFNAEQSQAEDEDKETELRLSNLMRVDGRLLIDGATIEDEELIQRNRYQNRWPDKVESEETGNEGVDATHFYHDSVFVLMPNTSMIPFRLANLSCASIVNWLRDLQSQVQDDASAMARETITKICTTESCWIGSRRRNRSYRMMDSRPDDIIISCIKACEILQDHQLLLKMAAGCCGYDLLGRIVGDGDAVLHGVYAAFAKTVHTFSFDKVRPSFEALADDHRELAFQFRLIATYRSEVMSSEPKKQSPTTRKKYDAWERQAIKRLLGSTKTIHILPFLASHTSESATLVAILVEMSVASRNGIVPERISDQFFDTLISPTVSLLSLELLHPKQDAKEPLWPGIDYFYSHPSKQYEDRLGQQIAQFYCICRIKSLDEAARSTLAWLKKEATTAHVVVFPRIILPLLKTWLSTLEDYNLQPTPELQETCTFITKAMAERCLGPEPIKPTNWTRKPRDCNDPSHEDCVKLNAFLTDPDREKETFEKIEHYFSTYEHDVRNDENYYSWPKTYIKTSSSWEQDFREWKERLDKIQRALPLFKIVKDLYGEGYLDVQGLLWQRKTSQVIK
ncbi:MAG: hypothetical protein Q9184_001080 [Pyrenodesmia sp. 2 TL-2023]